MGIISLDCPHEGCRIERGAFVVHAFTVRGDVMYDCFCCCPGCHQSVIAVCFGPKGSNPLNHNGNLEDDLNFSRVLVHPKVQSADTPEYIPDAVSRLYEQGYDSLQRGNWDAAGMMFRKTLETALKHLHPDGDGMLFKRIESLPLDIGVTPAMKEWAHEIRDIGNESSHDDPETEPDARAVYNFTNMFLLYAFTMPGLLEKRKADNGQEQ